MISNYNFEKKIKKVNDIYHLEIVIPNILNNFTYKIYGSNGFYQNGKFTSFKNIHTDNILVFSIDKIQIIFINIKLNNNKFEYFDFLDMFKKTLNSNFTKNIKINIQRKSDEKKLDLIDNNKKMNTESENDENDSDESDSDESDSDESESDKTI